jgi:hypothetical protein
MRTLAYRGANPCARTWPQDPPLGFPTPHGREPGPCARACPQCCPGGLAGNLTAQGVLAANLQLREHANPLSLGFFNSPKWPSRTLKNQRSTAVKNFGF